MVVSASLRERLMLQRSKLYGEAASVSEETLAGISVVWAFNGQQQQIRKYAEKLEGVKKACNAAGVKIGITRGRQVCVCVCVCVYVSVCRSVCVVPSLYNFLHDLGCTSHQVRLSFSRWVLSRCPCGT